ncbi:MAG: hypothetical protein ACOX7F_00815 [Eubacteriales bacterium]|jgi:hypothetical protein
MEENTSRTQFGQMEESFYKLIEDVLPLLESQEGKAHFLANLDRLAQWVKAMPRSLRKGKAWSREEFEAILMGPDQMEDPRFGAYMDAFYEEYKENPEDSLQTFYDDLFRDEGDLTKVDWPAVWESVRQNYENWLKTEYHDEWLEKEEPPQDL